MIETRQDTSKAKSLFDKARDTSQDKAKSLFDKAKPSPMQKFEETLEPAVRSSLQVHPPAEQDPAKKENLSELERTMLDVMFVSARGSGTGYVPASRAGSYYNEFAKGLGDIATGLGTFLSAAWHEASFTDDEIDEQYMYNKGQEIQKGLEEVFPSNPEFQREFGSKLARGAGTLTGQALLAGASGGSSLVSTGLMSATFSGLEYEQALEQTGDEDKAFKTMLLNLPINSLEALPFMRGLTRLDKMSGGAFKQAIKGAGKVGVMEAVTEVGQTTASNAVAGQVYDETRSLVEGVAEGGVIGFVLGAALGGSTTMLRKRANDPNLPLTERQESRNAHRLAIGELEKLDMAEQMLIRKFGNQLELSRAKSIYDRNRYAPEDYSFDEAEPIIDGSTRSLVPTETSKKGWLKRIIPYFQDKGEFNENTRKILRDGENLGDRFRLDIRTYANDMKVALRDEFNINRIANPFSSKKVPPKVMRQMNDYMSTGEGIYNIPERLREPLVNMRMHLDKLTGAAVKVGLAEGELKTAMEMNKGSYIYRTYKKFTAPETWKKNVPANVINQTRHWLVSQYRDVGFKPSEGEITEMMRQLMEVEGLPTGSIDTNPEVRKRVADLKGRTEFVLRDPNDPTKTLKKYEEVPEVVRKLWGEEKNPFTNYLNTGAKIATLTQNHKTLADLAIKLGEGSGSNQLFFDPRKTPAEVKTEKDLVPLSKEDDIGLAPLDGVWTTPEVRDALIKQNQDMRSDNMFVRGLVKGNSVAKISLTVLSPRTFARNFIGSGLFLPAQGHLRLRDIRQTMDTAMSIFRNPESPKSRAYMRKMVDLGLLERSPKGAEMKALIADFKGEDPNMSKSALEKGSEMAGLVERGVTKVSDAYQLGDTFFRVQMFELEKARYRSKGVDVTDKQIADIVHNVYQDYSRAPQAIKNLRKNILLAPFITFYYEVVRTSGNTVRQFKHELGSNDPAVRRIGAERMVGFTLVAGLGSGATSALGQWITGIGDQEMEDLREWSSPWNKDATLIPWDRFNGGGRYINATYTDPYEIVKEPFYNFYRNFDEKPLYENIFQNMVRVAEPAMSPEIFTKATAEAVMGRTFDGRPIVFEGDTPLDNTFARIAHVWDGIEPGVVSQSGEIYEAMTGMGRDGEEPAGVPEAMSALLGQKIVKVDVRQQIPYAVRNYQKRIRGLRSSYLRTAREEPYSANVKELNRVNNEYRKEFEAMSKKMQSAFRLGISYPEIKQIYNDANMSEENIRDLWIGTFKPMKAKFNFDDD